MGFHFQSSLAALTLYMSYFWCNFLMKIPTATFVHDWNNFCANIARIALTSKSCFSVYNHEWLSPLLTFHTRVICVAELYLDCKTLHAWMAKRFFWKIALFVPFSLPVSRVPGDFCATSEVLSNPRCTFLSLESNQWIQGEQMWRRLNFQHKVFLRKHTFSLMF